MSVIFATGVNALLLKFLQKKNSPHDVQTKGGGVNGLLSNVKKTALFLHDGFPKAPPNWEIIFARTIMDGIIGTFIRRNQL